MSAFGEQVNMAYAGTAVNEKFKEVQGSDTVVIAPWTSATPLSGELLQTSLDALLQNDINLLSAYPDAYAKDSYSGTAANVQKVVYSPLNDEYSIEAGKLENSVDITAELGSLTGETTTVSLGSTVPSAPFKSGEGWNYGLFGVSASKPTWFDCNVSALQYLTENIDKIKELIENN